MNDLGDQVNSNQCADGVHVFEWWSEVCKCGEQPRHRAVRCEHCGNFYWTKRAGTERISNENIRQPSGHQQAAGDSDSLSDVPHQSAPSEQHMGTRQSTDETVFGLRRNILSLEAQREDMQQPGMPEGAWTISGSKAVANRVDRLRGLGNAIVPQVAFQLIKRMIEAEQVN